MSRWGGNYTRRARAFWTPLVAAGDVDCPRCGLPIDPASPWDVGHALDRALGGTPDPANLHPEHASCNRSAGGRLGHQLRRAEASPRHARRPIKRRPWL